MSREIGFRAYIKPLKRYATGIDTIQFHKCCDVAGAGIWSVVTANEGIFEFDDIVIEQDTGLKDKNGEKICEGDIVKCYSTADEPCLAVVRYGRMPSIRGHEYCPCKIGFYLDDEVYFDENFGEDDDHGDFEVIGNIHENPELLGGKE